MQGLHDLISERFGVRVREREQGDDPALDTNDTIVLRADSTRLSFIVVNTGAEDALMRFKGVPSAAVNIPIAKNGGTMTMIFDEDFVLVGQELHGLVAANTTTLHIVEMLIDPKGDLE